MYIVKRGKFKLEGLSKPNNGTCGFLKGNSDGFWAKFDMPKGRFEELFKWCKSDKEFWNQKPICEIEYDSLSDRNVPINPRIVEIEFQNE